MRVLFAACLSVNLLVFMAVISSAKDAKSLSLVKGNKTKHQAKLHADKMMVCNLIQDSHVNIWPVNIWQKFNLLFTAAPVFSFKEQYDKHK